MRRYLNLIRNWRVDVIAAAMCAAFVLLLSESESLTAFVMVKAAGLLLLCLCCLLVRRWERKGLIPELTRITEDEV